MQSITPFLWFNHQAEEAANFYVSIFPKSKVLSVQRYGEAGPGPKGSVMTVEFRLNGQNFIALNGGPTFSFTPAISFSVDCKTQKELDGYWRKLLKGGEPSRCGWLTDKYGLSWQLVPSGIGKLVGGKNAKKSAAAMTAMMKMIKLDIKKLRAAYDRG